MNKNNFEGKSDSKNKVLKKLNQLEDRVPGRTLCPEIKKKRTLIACQLLKIAKDRIIIQMGQIAYELPIEVIEDIQDIKNPVEVERKTGVDVVILVQNWIVRTQVGNGTPTSELPFPLAKSSTTCEFSEEDRLMIRARTERWMKLNGLLFEVGNTEGLDFCSTMTLMGNGEMACDERDPLPEENL